MQKTTNTKILKNRYLNFLGLPNILYVDYPEN